MSYEQKVKQKSERTRVEFDLYPTPQGLCNAALSLIPTDFEYFWVLDPGAGGGEWAKAAYERKRNRNYIGVELRDAPAPWWFDVWLPKTDFLTWDGAAWGNYRYDLVVGNPPYEHAEAFIRKSLSLTRPGGYVLFLLRLAFLESQSRGAGLWRECPPKRVAVCSKRPSFTGNGKTDATAYAVYLWQKGWQGSTSLSWLEWDNTEADKQALLAKRETKRIPAKEQAA